MPSLADAPILDVPTEPKTGVFHQFLRVPEVYVRDGLTDALQRETERWQCRFFAERGRALAGDARPFLFRLYPNEWYEFPIRDFLADHDAAHGIPPEPSQGRETLMIGTVLLQHPYDAQVGDMVCSSAFHPFRCDPHKFADKDDPSRQWVFKSVGLSQCLPSMNFRRGMFPPDVIDKYRGVVAFQCESVTR